MNPKSNTTRWKSFWRMALAAALLLVTFPAGLPEPVMVHGVQQKPYEGVSMTYTFEDAQAADRHETQYFEMMVNRGIYHKGWTAVTRHSIPWMPIKMPAYDDDVWELYAPDDWTQAHDFSTEMPEKMHELQRLFLIEAVKYNALPLDDRIGERFNNEIAGRPTLIKGKTQLLFSGMGRLAENTVLNLKNKSHAVTAELVLPDGEANGVIVAQGGGFGGYMTLYALIHEPDVFKAGVAGSGPTDWSYYDTIYTERYMRTPSQNPDGYATTNLIAAADQLQAAPLIIHGLNDTNVHLQNSINFIQALEQLDRPFEFLPLPNLNHSYKGDGLATALVTSVDYFTRTLGGPLD